MDVLSRRGAGGGNQVNLEIAALGVQLMEATSYNYDASALILPPDRRCDRMLRAVRTGLASAP